MKTKEVQYKYDAFDRRIAKDVDDNGDGTYDRGERYVYDGSDIVLAFTDAGALTERLLYGPGVDQPLASEDGSGNVRWLLADNQGTIRDVAAYDAGQDETSVVNHLQYGSFGNITGQTNSSEEPRHTYTGREWDADAELYYYRARWYDARVGRFISEDPIGFGGGDANLSRYVGNDPVGFTDATGLQRLRAGSDDPTLLFLDEHPEIVAQMAQMRIPGDMSYADLGYSNAFVGWIGENFVRWMLDDDRLAQQGGFGDDVLLTATLVTELTGYVDPTPISDVGNAMLLGIDGRHGEAMIGLGGAAAPGALDRVIRAIPFDKIARNFGPEVAAELRHLDDRVQTAHDQLDSVAFRNRTTAGVSTNDGVILGSSEELLTRPQRNVLGPDEILARGPGHAEPTVLNRADQLADIMDTRPRAIVASRDFCPDCVELIQKQGATIVDDRAAVFPLLGINQ